MKFQEKRRLLFSLIGLVGLSGCETPPHEPLPPPITYRAPVAYTSPNPVSTRVIYQHDPYYDPYYQPYWGPYPYYGWGGYPHRRHWR